MCVHACALGVYVRAFVHVCMYMGVHTVGVHTCGYI